MLVVMVWALRTIVTPLYGNEFNSCCEELRIVTKPIMRAEYRAPEDGISTCCVTTHSGLCAFRNTAFPHRHSNFTLLRLSIQLNADLLLMWFRETECPSDRGGQSLLSIPPPTPSSTSLEPTSVVSGSEESELIRKEKSGRSAAWKVRGRRQQRQKGPVQCLWTNPTFHLFINACHDEPFESRPWWSSRSWTGYAFCDLMENFFSLRL